MDGSPKRRIKTAFSSCSRVVSIVELSKQKLSCLVYFTEPKLNILQYILTCVYFTSPLGFSVKYATD